MGAVIGPFLNYFSFAVNAVDFSDWTPEHARLAGEVAEIKSRLARRKAPLGSEALATRVRRTLTDLGNMFRSGPEDAKKEAAVFQEPGSLPTLKSLPMTTRTWTASKAFPSSRVSPVAFSL